MPSSRHVKFLKREGYTENLAALKRDRKKAGATNKRMASMNKRKKMTRTRRKK